MLYILQAFGLNKKGHVCATFRHGEGGGVWGLGTWVLVWNGRQHRLCC